MTNFNIPTINIPTINVSIDTSDISASIKTASDAGKNLERTCLISQLASYKVKTIPIMGKARPLCKEDRENISKIVGKLVDENWLDTNTRTWCEENGIAIKQERVVLYLLPHLST